MKKLSVKQLSDKIIPVATMAAGFAAAKVVPWAVSKVYKPADGLTNTVIGGSQIVAGIVLATMKNKHIANLGLGIAVSGAHTFLAEPIAKGLESAGLKGINAPAYNFGRNRFNPNFSAVGCEPQMKSLN